MPICSINFELELELDPLSKSTHFHIFPPIFQRTSVHLIFCCFFGIQNSFKMGSNLQGRNFASKGANSLTGVLLKKAPKLK